MATSTRKPASEPALHPWRAGAHYTIMTEQRTASDANHSRGGTRMTTLYGEKCVACRRDSPKVTDEEIAELHPAVPDWRLTEDDNIKRLDRTFEVKGFAAAMELADRVGEAAEGRGTSPAAYGGVGPRQRRLVDPQDQGPSPQRLHHGGQDRRAVQLNATRSVAVPPLCCRRS